MKQTNKQINKSLTVEERELQRKQNLPEEAAVFKLGAGV